MEMTLDEARDKAMPIFETLIATCGAREAVEAIKRDVGGEWLDSHAVIWLLGFGAKIYLEARLKS